MDAREELIDRVEEAQRLLATTLDPNPDPWHDSVQRQLDFVMSVAKSGRRPTAAELDSMSMGLLAVREFENVYPELADAVHKVMYRFRRL